MTATLDNSKKLYELTGWKAGVKQAWYKYGGELGYATAPWDNVSACTAPAYDSDYLLEKLPVITTELGRAYPLEPSVTKNGREYTRLAVRQTAIIQ